MMPTAQQVVDFLGRGADTKATAAAEEHLPIVTAMVKAYVRGNGFDEAGEPAEDLAAVIISATARSVTNPEHTIEQSSGPFSIRPGIFNGWTLPELAVLHRYRKRAL